MVLINEVDSLQLCDLPRPVPGAGEVLIEVRATGLNPSDLKNVLGRFPYTTTPRIPGRDFSGVVVEGSAELLGKAVWGGTGTGFSFNRDGDRKSTRLNSSHLPRSRMPSSA